MLEPAGITARNDGRLLEAPEPVLIDHCPRAIDPPLGLYSSSHWAFAGTCWLSQSTNCGFETTSLMSTCPANSEVPGTDIAARVGVVVGNGVGVAVGVAVEVGAAVGREVGVYVRSVGPYTTAVVAAAAGVNV